MGSNSFSNQFIELLLILMIALSGCSRDQPKITNEELEKNIRLWQESKISNYNFVVGRMTMGTWSWQPALIKVRKGQVVSKEIIGEPGPMAHVDGHEDFETVEKMFATIQEAYDKGYGVNNRYNSKFGYPEQIRIDAGHGATDQAIITDITQFEIIKD